MSIGSAGSHLGHDPDRVHELGDGDATQSPRYFQAADRRSVFPEVSKPIRRKLAVSDGVLNVLVAQIVLQRPSIHALIGQLEPG